MASMRGTLPEHRSVNGLLRNGVVKQSASMWMTRSKSRRSHQFCAARSVSNVMAIVQSV